MRPYLAIVQDSFREALSSRTLQALLALIVVLLAALALPGLRRELPADLSADQVLDPDGLAAMLGRTRTAGMTPAQASLRDRLSPDLQRQFVDYRRDATEERRDAAIAQLVSELNAKLGDEPFYEQAAWRNVDLVAEGRKLLARDWPDLSNEERRRLNRLLLDGAFAGYVQPAAAPRGWLSYVLGEIELPSEMNDVRSLVVSIAYVLLKWLVGAAGMLAAVIFTAWMIPQMFEPGAIDLLLSKPISRSAAFLAKFLGGCAFILLNASLFVIGLYLILGVRHGVWNARILLAIPVFLLAFAIYFSISAFVGARWRNPILAIALTLVAWMLTFAIHQVWYWGQRLALDGSRAEVVLPTEPGPIVARKNGELIRWSEGRWTPIFTESQKDPAVMMQRNTGLLYPLLGPVHVGAGNDAFLVAIERRIMPPLFSTVGNIVIGRASDDWRRESGPAAPTDAFALSATAARDVLLIARSGVKQVQLGPGGSTRETVQLVDLGPPGTQWPEPIDAALDPVSGDIAVVTRGRILLLSRQGGAGYTIERERDTGDPTYALTAITADDIVVARSNGRIERYSRSSLEPAGVSQLPAQPKRIFTSSNGRRVAILDHQRRLHWFAPEGEISVADVRGQRDITAAAFDVSGQLLAADRFPRVTAYSADGDVVDAWEHADGFAWVFQWFIDPLRTVLPKPDELDLLVRAAVGAGDESRPTGSDDLTREREYIDHWTPVWTSAVFVAVVLGLTCLMIERRDY